MSLLLEALKKAERAKEEAQRKAGGEPAKAELSLQDEAVPEHKHVVTRSELPDIHQPLEILSDDIGPATRRAAAEPKPAPQSTAGRPRGAARPADEAPATGRAAARKVFEVKHREPNPRLPFFITIGALGVAAIGIVVYFWIQLRPPQPLIANVNPPGAAATAPAPAPTAPAQPSATPAMAQGAIAGLPGLPGAPVAATPAVPAASTPSAPSAASAAVARGPKPSAIPTDPAPRAAARVSPAPARAAPSETQLNVARPTAQINPRVETAYAAYVGGDLAAARAGYEAALREEPGNRDALLGLAAVDVRDGRLESAEAAYVRLLRADPRDAHAHAGLLALRGGRADPVAAESRLKTLLASDPGAHVLHFSLANQLAQQGRWPEAQQHYFRAYSADSEHPDFAYNLAVSLDHLRQYRLARQYYERALALAGKRGASFNRAAAQERIKQLAE